MKKHLLLFILFSAFFVAVVKSQSLVAIGVPEVVTGPANEKISAAFDIQNVSEFTVNVKIRRIIIEEVSGSFNNMCWGIACYSPFIDDTPDGILINPGALENSFKGDYEGNGNAGVSIIKYCFYNADEPDDSTCVIVTFDATPVSIASLVSNDNFIIFPNPAKEIISVYSSLLANQNGTIEIVDFSGKVLKSELTGKVEKTNVDVSDLSNGIYFCRLLIEGRPVTMRKISIVNGK
jgi:hypothetical protein